MCTAKLLCFVTIRGFASQRLLELTFGSLGTYIERIGAIRGQFNPDEPVESRHRGQVDIQSVESRLGSLVLSASNKAVVRRLFFLFSFLVSGNAAKASCTGVAAAKI